VSPEEAPASSPREAVVKSAEETRPIPPDTLYALLLAEIAAQRQRLDISLGHYLHEAHKTGDAGVTKRAYAFAHHLNARQAALDAAELWASVAPHEPQALHALLLERIYAGHLDTIDTAMSDLLQLDQDASLQGPVGAAQNLDSAQRQQLIATFDRLSRQYPDSLSLAAGKAALLEQQGQYEAALAIIDAVNREHPEDLPWQLMKPRLLYQLGRFQEAEEILRELLVRHPDNHRLRLLLGRVLIENGKSHEARQQFTQLLAAAPQSSDLLLAVALISLETDRKADAKVYLTRLLATGDKTDLAHVQLGRLAETEGDVDAAIDHYTSVGPGEHFLLAWSRTVQLLVDHDRWPEARSRLQQARETHKKMAPRLYLLESESLSRQNRLLAAGEVLDQAIVEFGDNPFLLYSRAMLAEKLDQLDIMERHFRSMIALDPANSLALNALGYTLLEKTDRLEEARELIEQAFTLAPEDPAILDSMGWVEFHYGNHGRAIQLLRKAYAGMQDEEIAAHLGEVLWVTGQKQQARTIWQEALTRNPDSRILNDTIQRLAPGEDRP
jgi:Flp pilus assembly protein TadD